MDISTRFTTVDGYIAAQPAAVRPLLKQVRAAVKAAAPGATEIISYNMPAYKLYGVLVYFAAFKKHIGFYPTAVVIERFHKKLSGYKWAKGSVQLPLDAPLPLPLLTKMIQFKAQENERKAGGKTKAKSKK